MRRALRRTAKSLLTISSVVSLLLCLTVGLLWVYARRGSTPRISGLLPSGRYAIRFDADRIRLIGPPRPLPGGQEDSAWNLAGRIPLGWCIIGQFRGGKVVPTGPVSVGFPTAVSIDVGLGRDHYQPDYRQPRPSYPSMARPLMLALEDPDRWVIAHYLLWRSGINNFRFAAPLVREGDVYVHDMGGLRVALPAVVTDTPPPAPTSHLAPHLWVYPQDGPRPVRFQPSQQRAIVNLWHDRLGYTFSATPYWLVLSACLGLPGCWAARRYRQAVRARRVGRCRRCGYDLRASPDRCPECGTPAAK
jgi:hypothetical protein